MAKLRMAQWTTGNVGKFTLRGIIDNPTLELVGLPTAMAARSRDRGRIGDVAFDPVLAADPLEDSLAGT